MAVVMVVVTVVRVAVAAVTVVVSAVPGIAAIAPGTRPALPVMVVPKARRRIMKAGPFGITV
jgi:hypothetical protein